MDYTTPLKVKIALGILAAAIVVAGHALGDIDSGYLLGGGLPLILLAAWTRRDLRTLPAFWAILFAWALFDVLVVMVIRPGLYIQPAIIYAPLFIIYYIIVLGSLFLLEKAVEN